MNKSIMLWVGLAAALALHSVDDARLRACLAQAEQNNLEMQMAGKSLDESGARKLQALSGLLPSATISSSMTRFDKEISLQLSSDMPAFVMQPKESTTTKLEVSQVLFSPGAYYNYQVQRQAHKASEYGCRSRMDELRMQVVESYYGCQKAAEVVEMRRSALAAADENLRLAQTLYDVGKVPQTDLLRARVGKMSSEQDLRDAENQAGLAANSLNRMLGLELTAPVVRDTLDLDQLIALNLRSELTPAGSPEEAVAQSMSNRPEIQQIDAGLRSMKLADKAVFSGYLPSLVAVGDYGYSRDDFHYTSDDHYWTVTGMLQWNIFSGFATTGRVREVRAQLRNYELSSANTRKLIELDVRNSHMTYTHDLNQFEVARSTYQAAKSNYDMVKQQYENDLAPMVTLMDAKSLLDSARVNLVISYYSALTSGAQYRKSIGSPVWDENGENHE
jgi:outer membrane protein